MEPKSTTTSSVHELPFLSRGVSSLIYEFSETAVIKAPCGADESRHQLDIEGAIYERLGSHPYITKVLSIHQNMLVLERLQYPLRKRLWDLRDASMLPPTQDVLRWAAQIAQGLQHAHSRGVLQVDIGPHNVLLDWNEDVKLSDFAGSSIHGSEPLVLLSAHSEHPGMPSTEPSLQSEMFALGSMIYEIETTRQPYYDKLDSEIERLFGAQQFPDTSALVLGQVIAKCWKAEYKNVDEAREDIIHIQKILEDKYSNTVQYDDEKAWWGKR